MRTIKKEVENSENCILLVLSLQHHCWKGQFKNWKFCDFSSSSLPHMLAVTSLKAGVWALTFLPVCWKAAGTEKTYYPQMTGKVSVPQREAHSGSHCHSGYLKCADIFRHRFSQNTQSSHPGNKVKWESLHRTLNLFVRFDVLLVSKGHFWEQGELERV